MKFVKLRKLKKGDKVAILSPSFAAPGVWPHIYELGLKRLRDVFELEPVEFPSTKKVGASTEERAKDLIAAFSDSGIKAVIATIGGDDQVTYIKNLPGKPFRENPKPFFGFSDNTHFINHLWQNGIPSYYGGCLFTQFGMPHEMDEFTVRYLNHAFFGNEIISLEESGFCKDISFNWDNSENVNKERPKDNCGGWVWGESNNAAIDGFTWGGCLESIDEMLRHNFVLPSLEQFKDIVLFIETSEELPSSDYVHRVLRALGERGVLKKFRGMLVGRPQAWSIENPVDSYEKRRKYREDQQVVIFDTVKKYNKDTIVVQNIDFGHTDPQICLPTGSFIRVNSIDKKIEVQF